MSFVDFRFLAFLPIVMGIHYLLPQRFRWALLLVASYVFYMAWKPEYGLLLLLITTIDFVAGIQMGKERSARERRAWLCLSLAGNLGILFTFKYFNFAFGSLQSLLRAFGNHAALPALSLLLPIGISFHVFQSVSYTIEVYLRRVEPTRHFGKFALYVSFFPQLVAGPIERPTHLLRQINEGRSFVLDDARNGAKLIVWGFFKKLVIADNLAPAVAAVYAAPSHFPGPSLMIVAAFFSYQIYCDFSGYTDIARGTAKLFGYDLMLNFNRPYASQSVREFWQRWHISLSTWFRDYLYIPLGGNRVPELRHYENLMVTFLLSGLWHGANWTFVAWGGMNGGYLVLSDLTKPVRDTMTRTVFRGPFQMLLGCCRTVFTFSLVSLTWVFFRSPDFTTAAYMLTHMTTGVRSFLASLTSLAGLQHVVFMGTTVSAPMGLPAALCGIVVLEVVDYYRAHGVFGPALARVARPMRFALYGAGAFCVLAFGRFASSVPFIYFQF
jgi:alginate O-acetyltransferase complex protein AlgI